MDFDESRPIWMQILEDFQMRICTKDWGPGQRLPSVRDLALELKTNPNTVQKALTALDGAGLTYAERTAGRFVTTNEDVITMVRSDLASTAAQSFVRDAKRLGMELGAATQLVEKTWQRNGDNVSGPLGPVGLEVK